MPLWNWMPSSFSAPRLPLGKPVVVEFPSFTTRWRVEVTHEHECQRQTYRIHFVVLFLFVPNTLSTYSIPMLRDRLDEDDTVSLW